MASDWVRMRTDLYRDPKVCRMAELLLDPDGPLARSVSQLCQCDMAVTRNVTRNATVGALVTVWGVARHRGRRAGDDLVMPVASLATIDDIADVPGFGAAMEAVGWARVKGDGVVFPCFFEEYNTEPTADARSKAAERQKRYRDRRNAKVTASPAVAVTSQSNGREEKSRGEKKREEKEEPDPSARRFCPAAGADPPPDPAAVELAEAAVRQASSAVEPVVGWAEFAAAWEAAGLGRGKPVERTSQRVGWLQQRCRDPAWVAGWRAAVERLGRSRFARGETGKAGVWVDTFLEKPGTLQKALDGQYDDTAQPAVAPKGDAVQQRSAIFAAAKARNRPAG